MSTLIKSFLLVILSFCTLSLNEAEATEITNAMPYQIYPGAQAITIQTRAGYRYSHLEGDSPDWRLGILQQISYRSEPLLGDGEIHTFSASNKVQTSGYHFVEESAIEGKLHLHFAEDSNTNANSRVDFRYYIRRDNTLFLEGQVSKDELGAIPPLTIPYGDYTFQAVAVGYSAADPIPFSLTSSSDPYDLDVVLKKKQARIRITALPEDSTEGLTAILRRIDPQQRKTLWQREVAIDQELIEVDEGQYTVEFPTLEGFISPGSPGGSGSSGILGRFDLKAGHTTQTISGEYTPKPGKLIVSYKTDKALQEKLDQEKPNNIAFKLTHPDGTHSKHSFNNEQTAVISGLPPGTYKISFLTPKGAFKRQQAETLTIRHDGETYLDRYLEPEYSSVDISARFPMETTTLPQPEILLRDANHHIVDSEKLLPGHYTAHFEELDDFETPSPIAFEVLVGKEIESIVGEYTLGKGSLIVNYSTGVTGERLDRTIFWLINSQNNKKQRYPHPQDNNFTEDSTTKSRQIEISNLTVGRYQIEFTVPNADKLFADEPAEDIWIKKRKTTQFDKLLSPRYGSLEVLTNVADSPYQQTHNKPQITLKNTSSGKLIKSSETGRLITHHLTPSKYLITFEDLPTYQTPPPISIDVRPGETITPIIGEYKLAYGSAFITYDAGTAIDRLQRIHFWLIDERGSRRMFPEGKEITKDITNDNKCEILIENLYVGSYTIEFLIPNADNLFEDVEPVSFQIQKNKKTHIENSFIPRFGSISARIDMPPQVDKKPTITLVDAYGDTHATSTTGYLAADKLSPGEYRILFEELPSFNTPHPIKIDLAPHASTGPFIGNYVLGTGTLIVEYNTGPKREHLDEVQFTLFTLSKKAKAVEIDSEILDTPSTESQRQIFRDLPVGEYRIASSIPSHDGLFSEQPTEDFTIRSDQVTSLSQTFRPQYGGMEASIRFLTTEEPVDQNPAIQIADSSQTIIAESLDGYLLATDLPPGDYTLQFRKVPFYQSPDPLSITVEPNAICGPFVGEYLAGSGNLTITYNTGDASDELSKVRFWLTDHKEPYPEFTKEQAMKKVLSQTLSPEFTADELKQLETEPVKHQLAEIVNTCFAFSPEDRPSCHALIDSITDVLR